MLAVVLALFLTPYLLFTSGILVSVGYAMVSAPERIDDMLHGGLILFLSFWCVVALMLLWGWAL